MKYNLFDELGVIILYITHKCNLKCSYCFSTFNHPNAKNDFDDIPNAIENLINFINSSKKDNFTLVFFGGEPTLRWDLCKEIYKQCEQKSTKKMIYRLQTNGTLLNKVFDDLDWMDKLEICVSFDSNKQHHDKYRIFYNNSGSYDIIYNNIKQLIHSKYINRLSSVYTYHPNVASTLSDTIIGLFEMGIPKLRSSIIKENGVTEQQMNELTNSYKRIVDYLLIHTDKEYQNFGLLTFSEHDKIKKLYQYYKNNLNIYACRAGQYKVWINSDGNIYPCTTLIEPQYIMGNIHDKTFTNIVNTTMQQLERPECFKCDYRSACQFCLYRSVMESGTLMHCSEQMKHYGVIKLEAIKYLFEQCIKNNLLCIGD